MSYNMCHTVWLTPLYVFRVETFDPCFKQAACEWQFNIKRVGTVFTSKIGSDSCRTRRSSRSENISSQTEVQSKPLPSGTTLLRRTLLIFSISLIITWSPIVITYVVRSNDGIVVGEVFCDYLHRVALTMPFLRILSRL